MTIKRLKSKCCNVNMVFDHSYKTICSNCGMSLKYQEDLENKRRNENDRRK